jgi:hypothetical protein
MDPWPSGFGPGGSKEFQRQTELKTPVFKAK